MQHAITALGFALCSYGMLSCSYGMPHAVIALLACYGVSYRTSHALLTYNYRKIILLSVVMYELVFISSYR